MNLANLKLNSLWTIDDDTFSGMRWILRQTHDIEIIEWIIGEMIIQYVRPMLFHDVKWLSVFQLPLCYSPNATFQVTPKHIHIPK